MKLGLPRFNPTARERQWVENEIQTSRFIQSLWKAAGRRRRQDPGFISLLVRCGWTNVRNDDSGWESTRQWRNTCVANYLGVPYDSDAQLAKELAREFPGLKRPEALLRMHTGITHYYKALRPATLDFVEAHAGRIASAFEQVSSRRLAPAKKVKSTTDIITRLGSITVQGRQVSPLNGLTATLACLDPIRRFPILNDKTRRLLRAIGESRNGQGALALQKLIGRNGVRHAFDLDVYSATADFSAVRRPRNLKGHPEQFRDVGLKSEIAGMADIAANRLRIKKLHNRLTNKFRDYMIWRQIMPRESRFDALVLDWKPGRHLLIEAKTAFARSQGRAQIRQAIGQLFDYRYTYASQFPPGKVDLAVLVPSKPGPDVRSLMKSLRIEVLWFERNKLEGTVGL